MLHFNSISNQSLISYINYYRMLLKQKENDVIKEFLKECEDESKKRGLQKNNENT